MQAVLFDMDGTLIDSEKLWDVSLAALYEQLGGRLTPEVRASMVGGSAEHTMHTAYADLGLTPEGPWVDAKSIVKVMATRAPKDSTIYFRAEGNDAKAALEALVTLVDGDFQDGP